MYPAVGLGSPSERVYINLGQAPFAWDFETNADNTLTFTPVRLTRVLGTVLIAFFIYRLQRLTSLRRPPRMTPSRARS